MEPMKCKGCRHQLLKLSRDWSGTIEIKCPRVKCGAMNKIEVKAVNKN